MRKYLIAAVAALTVVATTTAAPAQDQETSMTVKVTPTKAGTMKKPKNAKIRFEVENANGQRTLSKLYIGTPRTVRVNPKGLTRCSEATLEGQGPSACPRASRVGTGVANALLGVNTGNPTPLTFDVTAVVTGAKNIGFHLRGRELPGLNLLAPGVVSGTGPNQKGRNLTIAVPSLAQQPVPGTFAGLVSIDVTLSGKKGKRRLVSTTGCRGGFQTFITELTFIDNGVTPASGGGAQGSSRCRA